MTFPIITFSPEEMRMYERHGIAQLALNQQCPVPMYGCSIPLEDFYLPPSQLNNDDEPHRLHGPPGYCWMRKQDQAPLVIVASANYPSAPTRAAPLNDPQIGEILLKWHQTTGDRYRIEVNFTERSQPTQASAQAE